MREKVCMNQFIIELIGEYQNSLDKISNNQNHNDDNQFYELIYNKILIILNKIRIILED